MFRVEVNCNVGDWNGDWQAVALVQRQAGGVCQWEAGWLGQW